MIKQTIIQEHYIISYECSFSRRLLMGLSVCCGNWRGCLSIVVSNSYCW